jgi:hypothetical protein
MVIALIFRGVAFEFRFKAHRTKHLWDLGGKPIKRPTSKNTIFGFDSLNISTQNNPLEKAG